MTMTVEILYFQGCPSLDSTRAMVERVALEWDAQVVLVDVERTPESIEGGFRGSPTVLVDGRDIEPDAQPASGRELCCRRFDDAGAIRNEPPAAWLERALRDASERRA